MAIATFYHPDLQETDSTIVLSTNESAHAAKSRRLRVGSPIQLINGQGILAHAEIIDINKRDVTVHITSANQHLQGDSISVATAIPKGDRQRTMVDMLTQIGVRNIIPLKCERSVTRYKPSMQDKWQRFAIEACKQSQNLWLPTIASERSVTEIVGEAQETIVYTDVGGQSFLDLKDRLANKLTILVGPEGGFSEQEIKQLEQSCVAVRLTANILRTELACVVAASQARSILI